jgi:hypothetical protein
VARRANPAGTGCAIILLIGLVGAILQYTWPLLLTASGCCLTVYLWQVWDEHHRASAQLRESARAADERTLAVEAAQALAAAQPRGPEDRFATCPSCTATTIQNVLTTSARGTSRQCVFCSHTWTINHATRKRTP